MRMNRLRLSSALCIALTVAVATPTFGQSFEGLNLGKKKKKPVKKKTGSSTSTTTTEDSGDKEGSDKAATPEVPLPEAGLDLSGPAKPADKKGDTAPAAGKKGEKVAPTMSFDAVDVSGKSGDRQKLDVALNQFKSENYEQAALTSFELMNDPNMAALAVESQYLLAKSLYRMGLYHSSLGEFSKILSRGPQTKFFKSSLEWLFFISRKTVNEQVVLNEIAKYSNFEFPERFRNEFRYLLARYYLVRGKALDQVDQKGDANKAFDEVKRLALMIPKGDPFYAKGKYLEGLAYFRENKPESALESMKEVVRVTRQPAGPQTADSRSLQSLRELAFMQLGRTHYGAKQNRYAIFYFNKVERGNTQWLEALFEGSWAHYRIGQYEQALGNMITLSSPFFKDEYFPEALILKAVIYYENCRYRESTSILEDFERIYGPVQDELDVLTKKDMEAPEYYQVLADIQKKNKEAVERKGTDEILERILKLALTDQDLKKTSDSINELEGEVDGFGSKADAFKFSNLAKTLIEGLKVQRQELIKAAGTMAKGKLEFENEALKQLRGNALRIKFETTDKEKAFLEAQLSSGGKVDIVKKYKESVAVSDDHLYWAYFGEYWRDELGTYQYTLTKGCIEKGTRAGEQVGSNP
ncbi:MAG: adventurous gliding motility protein GltC [Myxococcaceae bacterium]|nr:adventurous gliding motility protein GltC [Myxococcaceae bacterium]